MNGRTTATSARQRASHDRLLRRLDWSPVPSAGRPLDAIIVPASRRAQRLGPLIDLASQCEITLVILASHDCDVDDVAEVVAGRPANGRVVAAEVAVCTESDLLRLSTSAEEVRALSGDRLSNLSLKRNMGLLLARYRGWQKIMFLDDDITGLTPSDVARVAHFLDGNRFAGFKTIEFPDNSVVCHANRLAGRPQGIFVSGAALGVNTTGDRGLEVFPDVYNEDWFAFAGEAQTSGVAYVGNIGQLSFNPFDDPRRATFEEFGDLIAEGLYALFTDVGGLHKATEDYWKRFIDCRRDMIAGIQAELGRGETNEKVQAVESLTEALGQLNGIKPYDCRVFLDRWQDDRRQFAEVSRQAGECVLDYGDAFEALGIKRWQVARFGMTKMPAFA